MKRLTLCLFLVLIPCFLISQNDKKIDSLIKLSKTLPENETKAAILGTIYEELMFKDSKLSFEYAKRSYELSKKLNYQKGIASGYLHFADYYKDRGALDSARHYYTKSLNGFKQMNSMKGILFVNHSMASFEQNLGNFDKALSYAYENINIYKKRDSIEGTNHNLFNLIGSEYELIGGIHKELGNYHIALTETLKALNFFEQKKDKLRKGDALLQLGNIEYLLGNYDKALDYTTNSYSIYKDYKDLQYQSYAANDIGDTYVKLQKLDLAKQYYETALKLATDIKNKEIEGSSLVNLGNTYARLKQYSTAIDFLNQGLDIHRTLDYKNAIAKDLNHIAQVAIETKRFNEAFKNLDESIMISSKTGSKENLSEAYYLRYKANKHVNDLKKALSDHEYFATINDSVFNITKSKQIEELRTIHETEKKEQQITLQKNEIDLLKQKGEINNLYKILFGIGFLLSLIGFYAVRQKLKHSKIEKEKLDLELEFKKKELTTHALHLAKKNEVLEGLKQQAKSFKTSESGLKGYNQLIRTINFDLKDDNNWENFSRYFQEVHKDFNSNVKQKFPELTPNELRLMSLLKMNLSSKEIANILNISQEGIKKARYRLRKKLNISTEDSLQDLILKI
ncbi:tetratricopeptide repeat protein [Flavivirga amylovorans]|uniref:Tetratricopeptide repeat protein n=1 Tax=Flavivirga amylovorans TaxID=870486 RepID=A0ABT8X4Z7_9FLAO|nr:tetratricopeptide repeat protein [Flavivirga amylovorans]MDO5988645.1 tetratricopeptide repeat protein [Flavivirga amylovorans]